jgi:hypothetical protein
MNVERMHLVLKATAAAIKRGGLLKTVDALKNALQNQVSDPGNAPHQQKVGESLSQLRESLSKLETQNFPTAWKEMLDELELWYFDGEHFRDVVDDIFSRNQITPTLALKEISDIHSNLVADITAVSQTLDAFKRFGISEETLKVGEAEIGILIPRESVNDELPQFTRELQDTTKIIKVFEELTTGHRRDPKIRAISSSDLSVLLDIWPVSGAALAAAIERIAAFYKQVLEIKKLKVETQRLELSDDFVKKLEKEANDKMEHNLRALQKELLEAYNGDKGRKNELETELHVVLNKIANKMDRGVYFEFRAGEPPAPAEGQEDNDQSKQLREDTKSINDIARRLVVLKPNGGQILQLSERNEKETKEKQ